MTAGANLELPAEKVAGAAGGERMALGALRATPGGGSRAWTGAPAGSAQGGGQPEGLGWRSVWTQFLQKMSGAPAPPTSHVAAPASAPSADLPDSGARQAGAPTVPGESAESSNRSLRAAPQKALNKGEAALRLQGSQAQIQSRLRGKSAATPQSGSGPVAATIFAHAKEPGRSGRQITSIALREKQDQQVGASGPQFGETGMQAAVIVPTLPTRTPAQDRAEASSPPLPGIASQVASGSGTELKRPPSSGSRLRGSGGEAASALDPAAEPRSGREGQSEAAGEGQASSGNAGRRLPAPGVAGPSAAPGRPTAAGDSPQGGIAPATAGGARALVNPDTEQSATPRNPGTALSAPAEPGKLVRPVSRSGSVVPMTDKPETVAPAHGAVANTSVSISPPGSGSATPAPPAHSIATQTSADSFAALDAHAGGAAPVWTHASAQRAEAGFEDPSLGWVGVRAEVAGGGIHAVIVPDSAQAAQVLGTHMQGLDLHLADHHVPVETLILQTGAEQGGNHSSGHPQGQSQGETNRGTAGLAPGDRAPSVTNPIGSAIAPPARGGATISVMA